MLPIHLKAPTQGQCMLVHSTPFECSSAAPASGSNPEQDPQALAAVLAQAFGQQQASGPSLAQILKPDALVSLLHDINDPAQVILATFALT